jgi:CheY-like chemotaxis protein
MKKILVADDSVTIQKVIALTFAEEPYDIQSVGSGSDALEKMKQWRPDLVLADVIMPQVNGYELCRAIKENEATKDIPVLLLAGTFEAFDEEEAKAAGANDFITKPFESSELIDKVRALSGDIGAGPEPEPATMTPPEEPVTEPEGLPVEDQPIPAAETIQPPPASVPSPDVPEQPSQRSVSEASVVQAEPDIWDILSEADEGQGDVESAHPAMGRMDDKEVVDFGSFDVGLDRESQRVEEEPFSAPSAADDQDSQTPVPAGPSAASMDQGITERSRVEERERDFFGFETEAIELTPDEAVMDEAIEEVTFEIEPPAAQFEPEGTPSPEPAIEFTEPHEGGFEPPVETMASDTFTPPPSEPEKEIVTSPMMDLEPASLVDEFATEEPAAPPAPSQTPPEPSAISDVPSGEGFLPGESTPFQIPQAEDADMKPSPEPPKAGQEPVAPAPAVEVPSPPPEADLSRLAADDPRIEELVRKAVEEKVEKIVWEVVPEMSEVLIREAIEKIRSGS